MSSFSIVPAAHGAATPNVGGGLSPPPAAMLLTADEAAKALAVCRKSLYSLSKSGELPQVKIGKSVRYRPADLERFILAHRAGGAQ